MASINQTKVMTSFSSLVIIPSLYPFSHKTSQISINKRQYHRFIPKVSCKSTEKNDQNHPPPSPPPTTTFKDGQVFHLEKLDRRNVLIGLGGLYGATGLGSIDPSAYADPVIADFKSCGPPELPSGADPNTLCCPPLNTKPIDFVLPTPSSPLRIRQAAHLANSDYIAKYEQAVKLMKQLDKNDPRSFFQQANVHCAYCQASFKQLGHPDAAFDVHGSWIFLPFHRAYLYFYEKILATLINDPSFALPFWNWDSPAGMKMSKMFTYSKSSPLYNELRNPIHQTQGTLVDLDYNKVDPTTPIDEQIKSNLAVMYRQVVSGGKTAKLFMGHPFRAGDTSEPGAGTLETKPHNNIHLWCGDTRQPDLEDMGSLYSAGRDPIFFGGHHSNVDRMWVVWKGLGGKRKDFTDPNFLNSAFFLYDDKMNLVRVKVSDCLDQTKFGYDYQKVEIPWLDAKPKARKPKAASKKATAGVAVAAENTSNRKFTSSNEFPLTLTKRISIIVPRPKTSRSKKKKEEEEEVLTIKGIELEKDASVKFDVFINEDEEPLSRPYHSEFAGSYLNVPHKHMAGMKMKTNLSLGITDLLEDLEAEDDDSVIVTLVPRYGGDLVTIGGLSIGFDS